MVKDKDKLFIECECADRCSIVTLEYLEDYKEFFLNLYRLYSFKSKKEIYEFSFPIYQAHYIVKYLQKRHVGYAYYIYHECKNPNFSGAFKIEWREDISKFLLVFKRNSRFIREREIYGFIFSEDQAKHIIDFLQNKVTEEVSS